MTEARASLLTLPDLALMAGLLAAMVLFGVFLRGRQVSTGQFFLGGRRMSWWTVCLSFVATEVSAATLLAVPATVFRENCEYLQFFIGSAAARLLIAFLFIPAFYKFDCVTIYEFLGRRFGTLTQKTASSFFFVTRLLGSAVRLMIACRALALLFGWPMEPVIVLLILVSVAYTALGGVQAAIWASVLQAVVILGAGAASVAFLGEAVPGGWGEILRLAGHGGRLNVVDWGPAPGTEGFWREFFSNPNILWLAVLNGFFGSMAAFGTDQDFMQRLLTVETRRASQKTMVLAIPTSFFVLLLYVAVGVGLYGFYAANPGAARPDNLENIFPHFVGVVMPPLLKGLLLSAIVLASIDSPLASLSTSFVTDFYRSWRPAREDAHYLKVSRLAVGVFGVLLAAAAVWFAEFDKSLWLAFKIGGVTFGSLLGVFLLGLLTRRRSDRANVAAMVGSAALMAVLLILSEKKVLPLGWSWLVILGTGLTFAGGGLLGPVLDREEAR